MIGKISNRMQLIIFLILPILLFATIITYSNAAAPATPTLASSFCSSILSPSGTNINSTSLHNLLPISLIIISVMLFIIGIAYGIGYAFGYSRLKNFAKMELAEIVLTFLIVSVFIGSAYGINSLYSSGNRFLTTCNYLSSETIGTIPSIIGVYALTLIIQLLSNLKFSLDFYLNVIGGIVSGGLTASISITPLAGLSLLNAPISFIMSIFTLVFGISLSLIAFIALIYNLFPIFLFAGIVLRTIPWTRAAGGAFLGIFIGFYIFFPVVINSMLSIGSSTFTSSSISASVPNLNSKPTTDISNAASELSSLFGPKSPGIMGWLADNVIGPTVYAFISIIISLILTFDFAETMGDFLGAPSFTGSKVLGKLI